MKNSFFLLKNLHNINYITNFAPKFNIEFQNCLTNIMPIMYFVLNFNDGYEVGVVMLDAKGYLSTIPLRNFGENQGDAKCFQHFDCPTFTLEQIKFLSKNFNRSIKYQRFDDCHYKII